MVYRIFKTNEIIRKKYLIRAEERKTKKNRTVRSLVLNIDVTNYRALDNGSAQHPPLHQQYDQ